MSDSDRMLELLRRGGSRYGTLRATIVTWRDSPRGWRWTGSTASSYAPLRSWTDTLEPVVPAED